MNFKYKLFASIFNFFNLFPIKKKDIFFILDKKSSYNGNLKYIKEELDKRGKFNYNYLSREEYSFNDSSNSFSFNSFFSKIFNLFKFFLIKPYKIAKSRYIFSNDNFFPIAFMNFDEKTIIIQLWHAPGAFKRFGASVISDDNTKKLIEKIGSKLSYVIISSKNISKAYEEAFSVDNNKILSFGIPRTDFYFNKDINNKENIAKIRKRFENKYPEIENKKIILYAPTFREDENFNENISNNFDFGLFNESLGEDYLLFFRSHPKITTSKVNHSIDVSNYEDEKELLLIADILITDYSSIMIEYSILSKPIIFYPFDLKHYLNNERGFYFDYNQVPGPIAKNTEDIIKIIQENNFDFEKIQEFLKINYDYLDDKASKRIVDHILEK